jgi:hypothetical protein
VALTEQQIAEFNLPTRPTKREGNRHAYGFAGDSVELDALPPHVLRDMVRDVIERHISPTATAALPGTRVASGMATKTEEIQGKEGGTQMTSPPSEIHDVK